MFMQLARELTDWRLTQVPAVNEDDAWLGATNAIFRYRPIDLLNYLEIFWSMQQDGNRDYVVGGNELVRRAMGQPWDFDFDPDDDFVVRPAALPRLPNDIVRPQMPVAEAWARPPVDMRAVLLNRGFHDPDNFNQPIFPAWQHLIYAYAIENTRIVEIFRRTLHEMLTGERLGRPNPTVLSWLRTTEEMFFTDRLGHWIFSVVSQLRNDSGAVRRNAYYRMFGMDLNHGLDDGRPYPYQKPEVANREFVRAFEQLLRETWRAYTNRRNQNGPNFTDNATLTDLMLRLRDMLQDRRRYGSLAREEFYSIATLSWFHLTVNTNNEVVRLLHAEGNNSAERLRIIGERVGLPAHSRSYNYFLMANELSIILNLLENWNPANAPDVLYDDVNIIPNAIPEIMLTIIDHWSAATGHNLKEFVGGTGQFVQETSFAMSRTVAQGGNGSRSLVKTK